MEQKPTQLDPEKSPIHPANHLQETLTEEPKPMAQQARTSLQHIGTDSQKTETDYDHQDGANSSMQPTHGDAAANQKVESKPSSVIIKVDVTGEKSDVKSKQHAKKRKAHETLLCDSQLCLKKLKEQYMEGATQQVADVSIWDFAGQSVFYTTHQFFLSHRVIYLLLTNVTQPLNGKVAGEDMTPLGMYILLGVYTQVYFLTRKI
jgi:hypothetical protein